MRAALNTIRNLDLDSITRGKAYFDNLSSYAKELLVIYEQEGRNQQEREAILKSDISFLLSLWGAKQEKAKEWEEESHDRESGNEPPPTYNYYRADWIEDLICQHLCNTGQMGCTLSGDSLRELLAGDEFCPAPDLSKTSVVDYYPSLYCDNQPPEIPELRTPNNTEPERVAFKKAIEKKFLEIDGEFYKWIAGKNLLGCFVSKLYRETQTNGLDKWFGINQVAKYRADYNKRIYQKWDKQNNQVKRRYKPILNLFPQNDKP